jgi:hypothetical protein
MDIIIPKRLIEDQKNNPTLYNIKKNCIAKLPNTIYSSYYTSNLYLIIIFLLILAAYTENNYIFGLFWLSIPSVLFYEYLYFPYIIKKKSNKISNANNINQNTCEIED